MDARVKPGHDERERKKKSEAKRRQTQGRVLPRLAGTAAAPTLTLPRLRGREWEGAAHLSAFHRGSRPKESFIARDAASGQASWDVAGTRFAHPFERALPAPACPSPATAPRAPVVVPESMMPKAARARVASPPAGTALARAARECLPGRVRQERGSILHVTISVTNVNGTVTNILARFPFQTQCL